jgi:imidazolonepropionase-like amidohydrolase
MVERSMTPLQTIQAATVNAAELVGVQDRGSLMTGLLADVIAVAGDPLQTIEQIREVCFVMKDGRIHKHPDLLDA